MEPFELNPTKKRKLEQESLSETSTPSTTPTILPFIPTIPFPSPNFPNTPFVTSTPAVFVLKRDDNSIFEAQLTTLIPNQWIIGSNSDIVDCTVSNCPYSTPASPVISPRHLIVHFDPFERKFFFQCVGQNGMEITTYAYRHTIYPSSILYPLHAPTLIEFPCNTDPSHRHYFHFLLPPGSCDKHNLRKQVPLSISPECEPYPMVERYEDNSEEWNTPCEWTEAEQVRFQRIFICVGWTAIHRMRHLSYLSKKNNSQIRNFTAGFLEQCRKVIVELKSDNDEKSKDEDSQLNDELLWLDLMMKKFGWKSTRHEKSLDDWKKIESNAVGWIRRLQLIHLLDDLYTRAYSLNVDLLTMIPPDASSLFPSNIPAPWWNHYHDRVLLHAVKEYGFNRYDDVKSDSKYRLLVHKSWLDAQSANESAMEQKSTSDHAKRRRKKKLGNEEDEVETDGQDFHSTTGEHSHITDLNHSDYDNEQNGILPTFSKDKFYPQSDDYIDVDTPNEYGLSFPASDVLIRRTRRLIEMSYKAYWKHGKPEYERAEKEKSQPSYTVIKLQRVEPTFEHLMEPKRTISHFVWTQEWRQRFILFIIRCGVKYDGESRQYNWFHFIHKYPQILNQIDRNTQGSSLSSNNIASNRHDHHEEENRKLSIVSQACDHLLNLVLIHVFILTSFTTSDIPQPKGNPVAFCNLNFVSPLTFLSFEDAILLRERLLFFAKLRNRILPSYKNQESLAAMIDTASPALTQSPTLPKFWKRGIHDAFLLRGLNKYGFGEWNKLFSNKTLNWSGGISSDDFFANEGNLNFDALIKRAEEVVNALAIEDTSLPLITSFISMSPFSLTKPSFFILGATNLEKKDLKVRYDKYMAAKRNFKRFAELQERVTGPFSTRNAQTKVPRLRRYFHYITSQSSPDAAFVTPMDVSALSLTAYSPTTPTLKPIAELSIGFSTNFGSPSKLDEQRSLDTTNHIFHIMVDDHYNPHLPYWIHGGLTVYSLGEIEFRCQFPNDNLFHSNPHNNRNEMDPISTYVCPIGYRAIRIHQSIANPLLLARYLCEVVEVIDMKIQQQNGDNSNQISTTHNSHIVFRVTCSDFPNEPISAASPHAVWYCIQNMIYDNADSSVLARTYHVNGFERFGFENPTVRSMISLLPNYDTCILATPLLATVQLYIV